MNLVILDELGEINHMLMYAILSDQKFLAITITTRDHSIRCSILPTTLYFLYAMNEIM